MRALVISDTHFGAWTGRDLLREERYLERLAPHLDEVDELIVLGDLLDLLFGSLEEALGAADGLLALAQEKLQGKRFVFLAGNHDHHFVVREAETARALAAAGGGNAGGAAEPQPGGLLRRLLEARLEGVEVDIRYPTYRFGDVLLAHGHHLDPHARLSGPLGSRILTRLLWAIAAGGPEDPRTEEDYEAQIGLLTEALYVVAQLPHGTIAQRNVFRAVGRLGATAAPIRRLEALARRLAGRSREASTEELAPNEVTSEHYRQAVAGEGRRQREAKVPAGAAGGPQLGRVVYPGDPRDQAVEAFARAVENLGWAREVDKIVFAHTHQPLADVRSHRDGRVRYWNTGSWIYEPDLSSHDAWVGYMRRAWPGTGVAIDTSEPEPRLVETLADLNPLAGGPGLEPG